MAPKCQGWNIHVVDHLDTDKLKEKYASWGVATDRIEPVDYVISENQNLLSAVPHRNYYDYIIASHVIEHVPDLIGFLQDCYELLKVGGVLYLVIPDKRFCFDSLRPVTTIGSVLDAYLERRTTHSKGTLLDAYIYHSMKNGSIAFRGQTGLNQFKLTHSPKQAQEELAKLSSLHKYIDVHAWVFTPSSFKLLINDLWELEFVKFDISEFDVGNRYEFYCHLERTNRKTRLDKDRSKLLTEVFREEKAVKFPSIFFGTGIAKIRNIYQSLRNRVTI